MRKVVLDTNVLISGVIASGYSASILDAFRRGEIKLVTSAHLLEEFSDVISRRRITSKYPKAAENAESLLDFLRAFAILTAGVPDEHATSPDRDDDFVLACALDEKADCIVSGDPHLLELKTYKEIPILTPKEFVDRYSIPHSKQGRFSCPHRMASGAKATGVSAGEIVGVGLV